MATPTMIPLANLTLGSNQANVTFSNISQNYRDLILIFNGTNAVANGSLIFNFNGDGSSTYVSTYIVGIGSGSGSAGGTTYAGGAMVGWLSALTIGNQAVARLNILDYSANDKHKTVLMRADTPAQMTEAAVTRWPSNAPISTITIGNNLGGQIAAGSTFELFGVIA